MGSRVVSNNRAYEVFNYLSVVTELLGVTGWPEFEVDNFYPQIQGLDVIGEIKSSLS